MNGACTRLVSLKGMLDPFQPEKAADVKRLITLLDDMHKTFIAQIKSRRGDRLSADKSIFTGDFWLGQKVLSWGWLTGSDIWCQK